jgi:glycosyltransferase involved in cell wall biosynthesis
LVIVGHKTWYLPKILSLIKELEITEDIVFTGPVYDELPFIYNLADLFLFPSFYEAFPAVPLEAMASGTPVITSNTGGLPEVVGDAALQASPNDPNTFADAIVKILSSKKLRKSMIEKGFERTKNFSWEYSAKKTLDVYSEMARI